MNKSKFLQFFETYLPFIALASFFVGVGIASSSVTFANIANGIMSGLIDGYQYLAPLAIFIILTPSLIKIVEAQQATGKSHIAHIVAWLAQLRLLACIWGVVFTSLAFGLPFFVHTGVNFWGSILDTLSSIGYTLMVSPVFYALYAAIIMVFVSLRVPRLNVFWNGAAEAIELIGKYFVFVVPMFMITVGAYIYYLPQTVLAQVAADGDITTCLHNVRIFGFSISTCTSAGMIATYFAGGFLTGLAVLLWHFGLLLFTKFKIKDFSIKFYFNKYWLRVYPLLWATGSEAISTPLNLHLVKEHYPQIKPEIRRFMIGVGSVLNINGTIIAVFVMAGLVSMLLGIPISFMQLFLIIPLVFLLGYSVPGLPGELLLFAGPVAVLLGIPADLMPAFLAIYIGFQIGISDSFRSGVNSTDNCLCALLKTKDLED